MSEAFKPGWRNTGSYAEGYFDENGKQLGRIHRDSFSTKLVVAWEDEKKLGTYYSAELARAAVERAVLAGSQELPENVQAVIDAARGTQHRIIGTTDRAVGPQIVEMLAPLHKALSDLDEAEATRR